MSISITSDLGYALYTDWYLIVIVSLVSWVIMQSRILPRLSMSILTSLCYKGIGFNVNSLICWWSYSHLLLLQWCSSMRSLLSRSSMLLLCHMPARCNVRITAHKWSHIFVHKHCMMILIVIIQRYKNVILCQTHTILYWFNVVDSKCI